MASKEPWKVAFAHWVDSTLPNHFPFFEDLRPPHRCFGRILSNYGRQTDCPLCDWAKACEEIYLRYMSFHNPRPPRTFNFEKNHGGVWRQDGGKYYSRHRIADFLPSGVPVVSPFLGGANVELLWAGRGHKVFGYDKSFLLTNFWQEANVRAAAMANYIEAKALDWMNPDYYLKLQAELRNNPPAGFATACKTWIVNRCCYDGILFAGYSKTKRLRRFAIQRLREFHYTNLQVERADFRDSIPANYDKYIFADPPYLSARGSLYLDYDRDLHKGFPHTELAKLIQKRDRWMITYDNVAEVRKLYRDYRKTTDLQWRYTAGVRRGQTGRPSREIIIVSDDFDVSHLNYRFWRGEEDPRPE